MIDGRNFLDRDAVARRRFHLRGHRSLSASSRLPDRTVSDGDAGADLGWRRGHAAAAADLDDAQAGGAAGRSPFIGYMFEWLRGHGVDDVIMSCGFMADGVRAVLGDGVSFGIRLRYVEEPRAARHRRRAEVRRGAARRALLHAQRRRSHRHRPDRAARAARAHRRAGDARADRRRGSVGVRAGAAATPTARSREFLEKPGPEQGSTPTWSTPAPTSSSARCSTRWRPAGTNISIERDVFPKLVGHGLYGYEAERLLAGHRHARAATCRRPTTSSRATSRPRSAPAERGRDALLLDGAQVAAGSSRRC